MSCLGYNRDVCDDLVTSRPFRFKKSAKKWWESGENSCLLGAESYQLECTRLTGSNPAENNFTSLTTYLHYRHQPPTRHGTQKEN